MCANNLESLVKDFLKEKEDKCLCPYFHAKYIKTVDKTPKR